MYRGVVRGAWCEYLALKNDDPEAADLEDRVLATELVELPSILPRFWKTDGYSKIRRMIAENFRVKLEVSTPPGNYYEFPYDWRLDNRIASRKLAELVHRVLPAWRSFTGNRQAKVILIGHSMGGLVGRYFTEVLGGWHDCRALITLGTPHRGSVDALETLANGLGWPMSDLGPIVRTFPSIYQLLPIYELLETSGGRQRVAEVNGLPGLDPRLTSESLRFHREIEAAVASNRKEAAYHEGYKIIPFVGTDQPTSQDAVFESGGIVVRRDCPRWLDPLLSGGDGTVPRISATPIELSQDVREHFLPEHHAMLQSNHHLLDSLRNLLAQLLSTGLSAIRGPDSSRVSPSESAISLDVDDVYSVGQPIEVRVAIRDELGKSHDVELVVTPVDPSGRTFQGRLSEVREWRTCRIEGLPSGIYQVEVRAVMGGQAVPTPVHNLFEITPVEWTAT
jgi:pimeloyl-ACP methyl ester carboxylesterase